MYTPPFVLTTSFVPILNKVDVGVVSFQYPELVAAELLRFKNKYF